MALNIENTTSIFNKYKELLVSHLFTPKQSLAPTLHVKK